MDTNAFLQQHTSEVPSAERLAFFCNLANACNSAARRFAIDTVASVIPSAVSLDWTVEYVNDDSGGTFPSVSELTLVRLDGTKTRVPTPEEIESGSYHDDLELDEDDDAVEHFAGIVGVEAADLEAFFEAALYLCDFDQAAGLCLLPAGQRLLGSAG